MADQPGYRGEIGHVVARYQDEPELLSEIFAIFLDEAPERLATLKQAVSAQDFEEVQRTAHSLANTTGALRAEDALSAARAVEGKGRSADAAGLEQAAAELVKEVEAVIAAIELYRSGPVE